LRNLAKYILPNYESTKVMFFKIPKFSKITILLVLIRNTYTQIGFWLQCTLKIFEFTKNKKLYKLCLYATLVDVAVAAVARRVYIILYSTLYS
jgi:hypothetical protein